MWQIAVEIDACRYTTPIHRLPVRADSCTLLRVRQPSTSSDVRTRKRNSAADQLRQHSGFVNPVSAGRGGTVEQSDWSSRVATLQRVCSALSSLP